MRQRRATVTLRAAGRFPEEKFTLSVERTAFYRGFGTAIGVRTVQEAFDAFPMNVRFTQV